MFLVVSIVPLPKGMFNLVIWAARLKPCNHISFLLQLTLLTWRGDGFQVQSQLPSHDLSVTNHWWSPDPTRSQNTEAQAETWSLNQQKKAALLGATSGRRKNVLSFMFLPHLFVGKMLICTHKNTLAEFIYQINRIQYTQITSQMYQKQQHHQENK